MFACKGIRYHECRHLGYYQLRRVISAIEFANERGKNDYNRITYNCNHWVENVAKYLGRNIEVSRNCNCIDGYLKRREIVIKPKKTPTKISFQPMTIPQPINYYNRQISYNFQPRNYYNQQTRYNFQPINYYNQ